MTVTLSGPESVTVPAGPFEGVYRFTVEDRWKNSQGETKTEISIYWVVKGIGWVKVRRGNETYERVSGPPPLSLELSSLNLSEGETATCTISGGVAP
ncbi:MAG: hypothetical protein U5R49_13560 [Deltaproteobacteria bacterium]|nr:hypothetical protein [Deltaproteobacteria bacterium]